MKVLLINGSPHEKGCTYTALSLIAGELKAQGIETEILHVLMVLSRKACPIEHESRD